LLESFKIVETARPFQGGKAAPAENPLLIAGRAESVLMELRDGISNFAKQLKDLEPNQDPLQFPDIMTGLAGNFAEVYSACLEPPKHFFYMCFLTCLGALLSGRVSLASELSPQTRLYTLILGESADDRKSTAIAKTVEFFRGAIQGFPVCRGVGSAEGLQERLNEENRLLLYFDEFKAFVGKCKIESSVLLPCVTTLFESNWYESRVKGKGIRLENAHLSLLAASTVQTYERTWDPSFTDIGFNNRLFLVPGAGERKYAFPDKISGPHKESMKGELGKILKAVNFEMDITPSAKALFEGWYLSLPQSIHTKRLDTYALRLMPLLSVNDNKHIIEDDVVKKVLLLCDWQLRVRQLHDPIDADNKVAAMEEKMRRLLRTGPKSERDLKRGVHVERSGLWFYETAIKNLQAAGEIKRDKVSQQWALL
jgi:hypothetical protein